MWTFHKILFILQNHYSKCNFQIFVKGLKKFFIGSSSFVAPQLIHLKLYHNLRNKRRSLALALALYPTQKIWFS